MTTPRPGGRDATPARAATGSRAAPPPRAAAGTRPSAPSRDAKRAAREARRVARTTRRRDWLVPEVRRSSLAMGVGVVAGAAMVAVFNWRTEIGEERLTWLITLVVWTLMALSHALATWYAFAGRRGADLSAAAARVNPGHEEQGARNWRDWPVLRWMFRVDDAPAWSVTLAVCALLGVGVLVLDRGLKESGVLIGFGVGLVAVSWVNVVIMYAVQYARMDHDTAERAFAFPGDATERSYEDYLYVSLCAQATFGTTDVSALNTRIRRTLSTQSLVAFVFNTVILAIVVALLSSAS